MKNLLDKNSKDKTVVKITKAMAKQYPEHFQNIIAFNENNVLYYNNKLLSYSQEDCLELVKKFFAETLESDAFTDMGKNYFKIEGSDEEFCLNFNILACRTDNDTAGKPYTNKDIAYHVMHELMHISHRNAGKYLDDNHLAESFADVGTYFLYLKKIGDDYDFLSEQTFNVATNIAQTFYDDYGAGYTSNSMLVAANVAQQIKINKLTFEQIVDLTSTITEEFALPRETREHIYKSLCDEKGDLTIESIVKNSIKSDDPFIFNTGRYISLSTIFKEYSCVDAKTADRITEAFNVRNSGMKIAVDFLADKNEKAINSPTQQKVDSLIKESPKIKQSQTTPKFLKTINSLRKPRNAQ